MEKRTNYIFIHKLIKALADSLLSVFIPILILKNGGSLIHVATYLTVYYALGAIFNLVLKKFLQKYGVIALFLNLIPMIAIQFVATLNISFGVVILLAFLSSISVSLYSVPINLLFAFTDKNVNVAKFQIGTNIGKLLFILIGGYLIGSSFTSSLVFLAITGSLLYILSIIPILFGYKLLKQSYIEISLKKKEINKKSYIKYYLFYVFFSNFQIVLDVFLPIYLFINNLNFETIAIVLAGVELLKMFANLFAKFLVSKNLSFVSVLISVCCCLIGVILMLIVKTPAVLFICSSLIAISFPLLFVPTFSKICKKLKKDNNEFDGMSYRDATIFGARLLLVIPFLIFPTLNIPLILGATTCIGICITSYEIFYKDEL